MSLTAEDPANPAPEDFVTPSNRPAFVRPERTARPGGATDAASVKDRLLGKLGDAPASNPGYTEGTKGILTNSDGNKFDLSSIKSQITKQACDKILSQGKSLL